MKHNEFGMKYRHWDEYPELIPPLAEGSIGRDVRAVGRHYLDTQEKYAKYPGTGEWKPDLIKTPKVPWYEIDIASRVKEDLENKIASNPPARTIRLAEFMNWISPLKGQTMNDVNAYAIDTGNLYTKGGRAKIGALGIGAWGLAHDQQEMHTRGLHQYIEKATGSSSDKQFTGDPLTMEDIRPDTIWEVL